MLQVYEGSSKTGLISQKNTQMTNIAAKQRETAVYGCNPALLKFYQCRVNVLQSFYVVRSALLLCLSSEYFLAD